MAEHAEDSRGVVMSCFILGVTVFGLMRLILLSEHQTKLLEDIKATVSPPATAEDSTTSSQSPPPNATIEAHP